MPTSGIPPNTAHKSTLPTTVVLDELDTNGVRLDLDDAAAAALEQTGLLDLRPVGAGRWHLLPRGMVGVAQVGGLQVQVSPKDKIGVARLLFLLGYARDPGFRPDDVDAAEDRYLWPALAESLSRQAERALRGGVLQGYVTVEDALPTVRGRIRIGEQISRRPGMLVPLEVNYDDYTVDIAENRILRTALRRMLAMPRVPASIRAQLAHLGSQLTGVGIVAPGSPIPRWQPGRLNQRYHLALRLAELVLRHCSVETAPGDVRAASFVVSMWQVYEDFVTTALTEALAHRPGTTRTQFPDWLDAASPLVPHAIPIRPDLVHLVDGRPAFVVDAKYKAPSPNGRYPNADHYQMLAYCTALRLTRAWLVYAQGDRPVTRSVRNSPVSIVEYPLNLGADPPDLLRQVARLAAELWEHRAQRAD